MAFTSLNMPPAIAYTRNAIKVLMLSDSANTYMELHILDNNNEVIATTISTPDVDNLRSSFELSQMLDDHTDYYINIDDLNYHNQEILIQYSLKVEQYDNTGLIDEQTYGPYYAIKGGIAQEFVSNPFTWLSTNNKFLTHADQLTVLPDQPCFLDYLCIDPSIDVISKATLTFNDNTTQTVVLHDYSDSSSSDSGSGTTPAYSIIRVNASFLENALNQINANKLVVAYTVELRNASTDALLASIRINVDHNFKLKPRYFFYANSLGGIDCLYLSGSNILTKTVDFQTTETYTVEGRQVLTFDHYLNNTLEVATGYKSKSEVERMVEIMLNGFAFEILTNRLMFRIIADKSSKFSIDLKSNLNAVVLKYSRAAINRSYTPDNYAGIIDNEYNFDYNSDYTS